MRTETPRLAVVAPNAPFAPAVRRVQAHRYGLVRGVGERAVPIAQVVAAVRADEVVVGRVERHHEAAVERAGVAEERARHHVEREREGLRHVHLVLEVRAAVGRGASVREREKAIGPHRRPAHAVPARMLARLKALRAEDERRARRDREPPERALARRDQVRTCCQRGRLGRHLLPVVREVAQAQVALLHHERVLVRQRQRERAGARLLQRRVRARRRTRHVNRRIERRVGPRFRVERHAVLPHEEAVGAVPVEPERAMRELSVESSNVTFPRS